MLKETFGKTSTGETVLLYTFENSQGLKMVVSDFGASLIQLWVPDKDGQLRDVVLGYDTVAEYEVNSTYFGATIGRNANRLKGAKFDLAGETHTLSPNEGQNNLHSGPNGYHLRMWQVEELTENKVTFSFFSPDRDQGFPGNLNITVTYELTEAGINISYTGKTDQPTLFNPTNHTYFNLNGHNSGSIVQHQLELIGREYTPIVDEEFIPTGEIVPVAGTPMDFTQMKKIGDAIDSTDRQLSLTSGYDHNYVLDLEEDYFAKLIGDQSGIYMTAATNLPGVQFYSGNSIGVLPGKEGVTYQDRDGLCLETQFYPNAINEPNFTSPLLEVDQEVIYWTTYDFSTE